MLLVHVLSSMQLSTGAGGDGEGGSGGGRGSGEGSNDEPQAGMSQCSHRTPGETV